MKKIISIVLALIIALFALYQFGVNRYIPESGATDIVIYTTDWCPYCKTLRKTLDKYQIPYAEYDTEKSIDGMLGYLALGGHGVPVVVIGENIIYGYDGIEITDALADAGYELPLDWGSEY